jgi:hypothetical protein
LKNQKLKPQRNAKEWDRAECPEWFEVVEQRKLVENIGVRWSGDRVTGKTRSCGEGSV